MLTHPTLDQLRALKLDGMVQAFIELESQGRPHKFPIREGHIMRSSSTSGPSRNGGDVHDRIYVGLGGEFVAEQYRLYWEKTLISGVFNERTPVRGATEARQRVHFLGFVRERSYTTGEFAGATQFIANPHLFADAAALRVAIATWPLQPAVVLNGGD